MAIKSVYDLKPGFQNLLRPVCRGLVRWGCTAHQVTVAAVILSLLTAVMALQKIKAPDRL